MRLCTSNKVILQAVDTDAGSAWRRVHAALAARMPPDVFQRHIGNTMEPETAAKLARLEADFGRPLGPGVRSFLGATKVRCF